MNDEPKQYNDYQIGVISGDNVNVHQIRADNWSVSGNGLTFEDKAQIIAWFVDWSWWKKME